MLAADTPRLGSGLRLVSASAGTGKTYCLTGHVAAAVESGRADPEALVAVTFTTKAQAELEARLRHRLLERKARPAAAALPLAYMGTVHAVCLRLLKEFALEAGLAPALDVIPSHEGRRLLQATLEQELSPELNARLLALGESLEIAVDPRLSRFDVVAPIDDIMSLARGNRIAPEALPDMARRSWSQLSRLLPPPANEGGVVEAELRAALELAIPALLAVDDGQKNTREACELLQGCARELGRGRLRWSQWARLVKVKPGKRALPLVQRVQAAAAAYETHPLLHAELRELIEHIFEAARVALTTYAEWKARRGLLDFVDMVDKALTLVSEPGVARDLSERLRLVAVDEFQDTSPIQLAFFIRLHALVGESLWVGDRKQCIFEYAGADPDLMDAVSAWAGVSGGQNERLSTNYRSRPELVELCSTVFTAAFARDGSTPDDVATIAYRATAPRLSELPPVGVWWLEGREQVALAAGVAALLADPESTPVVDPRTGAARALRAGDIAVLVYSNADAERLSEALAARGIDSALPRPGLLTTPEGSLLRAALCWLVDRRDDLAAAELAALTAFDGRTHEEWLNDRLSQVERRIEQHAAEEQARTSKMSASEPAEQDAPACAACARLETLRPALTQLSPGEVVDRVLSVLDASAWAERWPDPAQRAANLEALRALAAAYEERCSYQREAASLAGLLRYFDERQEKLRQKDEERATDEQHVRGGESVVISTYHKAKGLEWPVVVLSGLDRAPKRDPFDVALETDGSPFDPQEPLAGRWIRYWPWPLGPQRNAPLRDRAEASDAGRRVAERERRERVRLLYVGWTRARDHLVLAARRQSKGPCIEWLNELADEQGPILSLPEPTAPTPQLGVRTLAGDVHQVAVRCAAFSAPSEEPDREERATSGLWYAPVQGLPDPVAYRLTPSRAATELADLGQAHVLRSERLKRRMAFTAPRGTSWDTVGTALHAFLAADIENLSSAERQHLAERVLRHAGLENAFATAALIEAGDALRAFIAERWPGARWHREIPIRARFDSEHGSRVIDGCIDLLLETDQGVVIIDHKSFPGRAAEWEARALEYAPQLLAYARALEIAGREVLAMVVHFTVGGGVVEIGKGEAGLGAARVANGERA